MLGTWTLQWYDKVLKSFLAIPRMHSRQFDIQHNAHRYRGIHAKSLWYMEVLLCEYGFGAVHRLLVICK